MAGDEDDEHDDDEEAATEAADKERNKAAPAAGVGGGRGPPDFNATASAALKCAMVCRISGDRSFGFLLPSTGVDVRNGT